MPLPACKSSHGTFKPRLSRQASPKRTARTITVQIATAKPLSNRSALGRLPEFSPWAVIDDKLPASATGHLGRPAFLGQPRQYTLAVVALDLEHAVLGSTAKVAKQVIYVGAPGAVTLDLKTLPYQKIRRPKWPIDAADTAPTPTPFAVRPGGQAPD